jgi:hypothetical protein
MDSYNHGHKGRLEVGWEDFGRLCREMAVKIHSQFQPDVVVGVARAGVMPGVVLASMFRKDFYVIKLSRRVNDRVVHARPILFVPITESVHDKKVLLVDEICVTGQTLDMACQEVLSKQAAQVRTATLFVHSHSKKPDFFGLETDDMIVNPWDHYVIGEDGKLEIHPEYLEGALKTQE